jgi:WD40 repeat protein
VLRGHSEDVTDVAFSPDGKLLASGGRDGALHVWDVARGVPIATLRKTGAPILGITFSPAGGSVAASGGDRLIRIWDAARSVPAGPPIGSGEVKVVRGWKLADTRERLTIPVDAGLAGPLAFAPDGLFLAGGCVDHVFRVWESVSGREAAKLSGHDGPVAALAFAPDGRTLASAGAGGIKLWTTEGWRETAVLRSSSGENPTALAFSGDSGTLVAGNQSGGFSLWDVPDRSERPALSGHKKEFGRAVFSPDGTLVAAGQSDGMVRLWNSATGAPLRALAGHTKLANEITFSPDGKTLASASDDGTARLWDVEAGRERAVLSLASSTASGAPSAFTVAFAPDGKSLSVAARDGKIHLFDVGTGQERLAFPKTPGERATSKPSALPGASSAAPAEGTRASEKPVPAPPQVLRPEELSDDQFIQHVLRRIRESRESRDDALGILRRARALIRSAKGIEAKTREGLEDLIQSEMVDLEPSFVIRSLSYAPDGRALASADGRGVLRLWNPATGEEMVEVGRPSLAAHPVDHVLNSRLISFADTSTSYGFEWRTGEQPVAYRVEYSPDGRFIAAAGTDGAIVLWDPSGTGEQLRLTGRSGVPPGFSFARDGQAFAYQAADSVRVIDLRTRRNLAVFTDADWVLGLAFAPDGTSLLGTNPAGLWAWSLEAAPGQRTLAGHNTEVHSVAVSPDGRIASGDITGHILLWSASGSLVRELTRESGSTASDLASGGVTSLRFSPSGHLVASTTERGPITVWDVVTGRARATLGRELEEPLIRNIPRGMPARNALAFSPDGRLFAAPTVTGKLSVWDTTTWRDFGLAGPKASPLTLSFGAEGTTIVAVYESGEINRWDLKSRERTQLPLGVGGAVAVISPDGNKLAVGRYWTPGEFRAPNLPPDMPGEVNPLFSERDLATGRVLAEAKGTSEDRGAEALAFSPDGRRIVAADSSGAVAVWDAASGEKALGLAIAPLTGRVNSVAFGPNGSTIITAGPLSSVYVWDAATGEQRASLEAHTAAVTAAAFAPDGATLATAGQDWTARLWNVATGGQLASLASHNAPVLAVAFSRDGLSLATCSDDGRVLLWDTPTGRVRGELPPAIGKAKPKALAFSPDGTTLATGAADGMVRLWRSDTLEPLKAFQARDRVNALAFNRHGRTLYAADAQGAVRTWSLPSGEVVSGPAWPDTTPQALVLDPSGKTLAVALADSTVRLWDIAGQEELHTLRGHSGAVFGLAFSPDGKTLATAAADHTVRLWDAEAGQLRGTLEGHSGQVNGLAFSPDGKTLASAGSDGAVLVWEIARAKRRPHENALAASLLNAALRRYRDELAQRTRDTRTILAKLEQPISMSFNDEIPLSDVLKYIKQATATASYQGIPIDLDPIGLKEAEKTELSSVRNLDVEGTPLKRSLSLLLNQLDLEYRVADGRLTITSRESAKKKFGATLDATRQTVNLDNPEIRRILMMLEKPIKMRFTEKTPLDDVLKYVRQATTTSSYPGIPIYVDPIGLSEADKTMHSPITYVAEGMPLRQSLHEILSQLDMMYIVQEGLVMITSKDYGSQLLYVRSTEKTDNMLERPVELSFTEPTALEDVIKVIRAATKGPDDNGLPILFARGVASKASGRLGTLKVVYRSKGEPLRDSLIEILTPLGLAYDIDGATVLIIDANTAHPE